MEEQIINYAVGCYNDRRVRAIRALESGDPNAKYYATIFIIDYKDMLSPGMWERWGTKLHGNIGSRQRMQLAKELRDANPDITYEKAVDLMARSFLSTITSILICDTQRVEIETMITKLYPAVADRMDEIRIEEAITHMKMKDGFPPEVSEEGQAPSD